MGSTYPENVRKTKACLCEKFSAGGEFSRAKVADVCGSNPKTPGNHLPLLQDKIICGEKKLVKVEGKNRWTMVIPDDPFESPLKEDAAHTLEEENSDPRYGVDDSAKTGFDPLGDFIEAVEQTQKMWEAKLPKLFPRLPKFRYEMKKRRRERVEQVIHTFVQ